MDIYVLNKEFEVVDIIDLYKSVIWTTRYYTYGDFELYLPASAENLDMLKVDYYLVREQDREGDIYSNVMIIKNIKLVTDYEEGDHLIVTGKCLKFLAYQCVIMHQSTIKGNLEVGLRYVIRTNTERMPKPKIELSTPAGFDVKAEVQVTGDEVGKFLEDICKMYGWGWDIEVDIKNKYFILSLYEGKDHSSQQSKNPIVEFSPDFDNLISSNYTISKENYKNVAIVAGEGEGADRRVYRKELENLGEEYQCELYVDARDISSDEEQSVSSYNDQLSARGLKELTEHTVVESFEGEIEPNVNFVLNKDYFLGDVVQIKNSYGISATTRVTEVIDCLDDSGRTVIPQFDTWQID